MDTAYSEATRKTVRTSTAQPRRQRPRAVMVAPDGAIGYTYSRSRSELYVIKGLK